LIPFGIRSFNGAEINFSYAPDARVGAAPNRARHLDEPKVASKIERKKSPGYVAGRRFCRQYC